MHAFFGLPRSLNNINALQRSPLFDKLATGEATACNFTINGHQYMMGYYLTHVIYPKLSTFVKTIAKPATKMEDHFAKMQEAS
jgi:hypothetical protein